ncbi:MAG: (d)CMP kinase [Candidatus Hydrogenedentota bacterium]
MADPATITHIVAIDGPAGAGKSTTARQAARALDFQFLDTGAMYRAATWWALHQGADLDNAAALANATRAMDLRMREVDGVTRVFIGEHDITQAIRTPAITRMISRLDEIPAVRERLVELQREIGARRPTVAEGRDIGTVVFPRARCKIYLDASIEERTRRRAEDLVNAGHAVDIDALREDIRGRDNRNMRRADSPLKPAEDAIRLDTSNLTRDEVVARIVALARERL